MTEFDCYKCGGSGEVSFKHIENGVCFACNGTGKLSYRPRTKITADPHPELLVPEHNRPTQKQWDFLGRLCDDNDDRFCKMVRAAGAPMATMRYMTKAQMSKAIDLARAARA